MQKHVNVSDIPAHNFGMTNFDHIFSAFLSIFQCITLEGWVDLMYMAEDAFSIVLAEVNFILLSCAAEDVLGVSNKFERLELRKHSCTNIFFLAKLLQAQYDFASKIICTLNNFHT